MKFERNENIGAYYIGAIYNTYGSYADLCTDRCVAKI